MDLNTIKNRDINVLKECLEYLSENIEAQMELIELYENGSSDFFKKVAELKEEMEYDEYDITLTEAIDALSLIEDEIIPELYIEELEEAARFGADGNNLLLKYSARDISVASLVDDYLKYKNKDGKKDVPEATLRNLARHDEKAESIREKIKDEVAKGKEQNKHIVDSLRNSYFAALDRLWSEKEDELNKNTTSTIKVSLKEDSDDVKKNIAAVGGATVVGTVTAAGVYAGSGYRALASHGTFRIPGIPATIPWVHLAQGVTAGLIALGLIYGVKAMIKAKEKSIIKHVVNGEEVKSDSWLKLQVAEFRKNPNCEKLVADVKAAKTVKDYKKALAILCKEISKTRKKVEVKINDDVEEKEHYKD